MSEDDTVEPDGGEAGGFAAQSGIDRHMLESLVCPVTQGQLRYDSQAQELISRAAHLAFPIRSGIPIMIASEAREME